MQYRNLKLALILASLIIYSGAATAGNVKPRTCSAINASSLEHILPTGGSGGTGHDAASPSGATEGAGITASPEGIGGTGIEAAAESGGIGGTGIEPAAESGGIGGTGIKAAAESGGIGGTGHTVPPGGIGGTGITPAGIISKASGRIAVFISETHQQTLNESDAICNGDTLIVDSGSQAKITFSDGAILHVMQNTVIRIEDYQYAKGLPQQNRSIITLARGDIRSISGEISKTNPSQYEIRTPVATIRVIGTDFLVTHLPENNDAKLIGTYTKVIAGEVSVMSKLGKILLRAGESSHVLLNGTQSIIKSNGGTCSAP